MAEHAPGTDTGPTPILEPGDREMGLARTLAVRYMRPGFDPDDLEGEAMLAMVEAAGQFDASRAEPSDVDRLYVTFLRDRIRAALRSYCRRVQFGWLAGVPIRLRRAALKAHRAVGCLAARGIRRPSPDQIAGEARLDVVTVVKVLAIPNILVRESAVDWAESRAPVGGGLHDPEIVPLFPVTSFVPDSPCPHFGPIEKGSALLCAVCHDTGMRAHPALRRNRLTDPKPETNRTPDPTPGTDRGGKPLTRREKRRLLFPAPTANPPAAETATLAMAC